MNPQQIEVMEFGFNAYYSVWRCQWREASYTSPRDEVLRVYTVCNVDVPDTDNWLRLPYLGNSAANRIYVHVRFSVRKCVNFPNPATLQQCKVITIVYVSPDILKNVYATP